MNKTAHMRRGLTALLFFLCALAAHAQNHLKKTVSPEVSSQRLDGVLRLLGQRGGFYFSYNSGILPGDSLVTLSASRKTVQQVLETVLPAGYEFRESGQYIIIRRAPAVLTVVTSGAGNTADRHYVLSGYVLDDRTGLRIPAASIYEKRLLASALTDREGYFRLRLKTRARTAALTVSKEFYEDTTVLVEPRYQQQITVTLLPTAPPEITFIRPDDYFVPDSLRVRVRTPSGSTEYTFVRTDTAKVEQTLFGNLLLSSRQKLQSINLRNFFTGRPFQVSLVPGLGTHGKLGGQVVNHFSLNIFGGYAGGVKGAEVGGLFNIDKKDVGYFQAGGLLNIVGGNFTGLQAGGLSNTVLARFHGLQAAGISNLAGGHLNGFQAAGIYNHTSRNVNGLQAAGIANFARDRVRGMQVSGIANLANRQMHGLQVAGLFNYAQHLKGVQVGLINIAGTSDGYGIGLINAVLKGYHKLSLSANELTPVNAAFKTGHRYLYSILEAGTNPREGEKAFSFGYGLGSEIKLAKWLSLNPEATGNYLYLGAWDFLNLLGRGSLNLHLRPGKYFSVFAGPVFNAWYSRQPAPFSGYRYPVPPAGHKTFGVSPEVKGWIGWTAGIHLF